MNIRLEITISSDELEIINLVVNILKTKVFKIMIFPGGFRLTSWDGIWPEDFTRIAGESPRSLVVG